MYNHQLISTTHYFTKLITIGGGADYIQLEGFHNYTYFPCSLRHPGLRLNSKARADICWWSAFLKTWNRISLLPPRVPSSCTFSDASGAGGCGAFNVAHRWFYVPWPSTWALRSIPAFMCMLLSASCDNYKIIVRFESIFLFNNYLALVGHAPSALKIYRGTLAGPAPLPA